MNDIMAGHGQCSGTWRYDAGQDAQRGRLASPVGPDKPENVSWRHVERQVINRDKVVIRLGKVCDSNHINYLAKPPFGYMSL